MSAVFARGVLAVSHMGPGRQVFVAGVGLAALLAIAAFSLFSLHHRRDAALRDLQSTRAALTEVQALTTQVQALQRPGNAATAADLASVVSRSLQSYGLQPSRLQQNSGDELQLRIDNVAFADAIAWLAALEELPDVAVVRVSFNQGPNGSASLSLSLTRA